MDHFLSGHASNIKMRMTTHPKFWDHLTWLSIILLLTSVIGNASFIGVLNNRRAALARAQEDEALLRRSESRFRDFADSSSDWYWEMDRDLRFTRFSENLTDIIGVSPESLLGKTREETGIPGIDPAVWKKHMEDLAAHRSFREFKHPRTLDNGEVLYLSINGKAIFDETGQFEGYRGTGSDITERQKNELALQRANEELEQRVAERTAELEESAALKTEILDTALDCVISIDQNARVIEWNESASLTFGYARDDAVGQMLVDLIVPPAMKDAHNAGFQRYMETNKAKLIGQRIEITAMRANGEEFPIEMAISAQDRKDGKIITAYLRDLSETKQAEARLQQAQKMEAVGQLTGGVAHDFNNLLGVILGNAEILSDTVGEDHPMPRAIMRAANRGAELTQRLLAFSRQQPLRPSSFDLSKLVTDMQDLLKRTLGATYDIKTIAPEDLWKASADPGQVENALLNLAINARDAMPGGGNLTIECSNTVLDEDYVLENPESVPGAYVQLSVSDDGFGMSEDVQARAFEPFFTTKDVGEGSGLGLSMIYGFAKQSNGHVAIVSEQGHGTTVNLYLPRTKEVAQPKDKPNAPSLPQGAGEKILIIEDDPDLRALTVRMVKTLSYDVIDVPDANTARDILLAGQRVDLVLSDIVLPGGLNGLEFADQIKVDFPTLKIIFMSGYPDKAAKQNGVLSAESVLLNKPFQRRQLAEALRDALV
jgi:PAS domain S-box-containing protein